MQADKPRRATPAIPNVRAEAALPDCHAGKKFACAGRDGERQRKKLKRRSCPHKEDRAARHWPRRLSFLILQNEKDSLPQNNARPVECCSAHTVAFPTPTDC